mmetsp:Transcript_29489/g.41784  ORF Transcript_29489/g.41784 Transcript_29489/m.41784 type:complete len:92 (+) Transcript_29489:148-423(+)
MTKKTRPDILNPVREATKFRSKPKRMHMRFVQRIVRDVIGTLERGVVLKPTKLFDGSIVPITLLVHYFCLPQHHYCVFDRIPGWIQFHWHG